MVEQINNDIYVYIYHKILPFLFMLVLFSRTGNYDIKQSLSIKRRQDRTEALQLPEETDPSILFTLGQREFKSGNIDIAIVFITKAFLLLITIQINQLNAKEQLIDKFYTFLFPFFFFYLHFFFFFLYRHLN